MKNILTILKLSSLILFLGTLFGFQSLEDDVFKFSDKYGNEFLIENAESIPNRLTSDFLKSNLVGTYFVDNLIESELRFKFNIIENDIVNRNNYRLRVEIIPQSDNVREILKHSGTAIYKLKIRKNKTRIELKNIKCLGGEV